MADPVRVACVIDNEFEDSEFRVPYDRMKRAGVRVDLVGKEVGRRLVGHKGRERVRVERSIDDVRAEDYQALFIPGGLSPDYLRADKRFVAFVRDFENAHKLIAAICHGAQLLLTAGLVPGRTLTAWTTVQGDLAAAGAHVRDEPLVRDGNWITSRHPGDLEPFCGALIESLHLAPTEETAPLWG